MAMRCGERRDTQSIVISIAAFALFYIVVIPKRLSLYEIYITWVMTGITVYMDLLLAVTPSMVTGHGTYPSLVIKKFTHRKWTT